MQIILLIVFLIIIYALVKKYFLQIFFLILIGLALFYYPKITIYSFIGLIVLCTAYFVLNKQKIKKECISLLNNDDFETFFKYYDKYSNEDKKIVIDLVKENFENFENLLLIIFHFDFRNFYEKQKGNSNDLIIFEKSDCIDSLSNIWKEETNSLLKKLKEDLNFEEISITKEKNNKTILIKISQEKEEDMIINDDIFKNAISLDD